METLLQQRAAPNSSDFSDSSDLLDLWFDSYDLSGSNRFDYHSRTAIKTASSTGLATIPLQYNRNAQIYVELKSEDNK